MSPIKFSLRYPPVTLILTAMVVLIGIHAFLKMQRTEDPTITIRTGLVAALYPGATSEQVEKQVTKTLEKHIFKFPEVRKEKTYSTSRPGLVIINVELEDSVKNADVFWAKLRHELNLVKATELPEGVRGPVVDSDFGDTVAMLLAVHGKRYGYRELRDYADKIHDEMRTVREVGKLSTYGNQQEEIWITSSLERMAQYFAEPRQVANALRERNVIQSGGNFDGDQSKIPMRSTGIFNTENDIRNVLVDVSKDGHPAYIKDFANVERRYQDPSFMVRYDGDPCLLLSVEMQKGKNIVELGEKLDKVMQRLKVLLPPDVQLDLVANQPGVVKERVEKLSHEFLLAIISVVLVTIVLLPLRVALIAALAIPVTLCGTLGVMDAMGIALHQVSIAGLIMVLGIVVDDAIVIADNYVELLDHKVPKTEAAWRCASDVLVPVLTATITIIASFLPLLIITGSVGEFIMALPVTVAIALAVSFVVAVMLTPMLCRFFIKKGLHDHDAAAEAHGKKKRSLLDLLQDQYGVAIARFMKRKWLAYALGGAAFVFGVLLFAVVPQQFFPSAERNQFVIDVWMPQGTRIEATDSVMGRIEKSLASRKGVAHYATFVGQSAPRFYYNVNPQQPDGAYGQFIVNTTSIAETSRLVKELRPSLAALAPEATVIVKELQQGAQMEAPVEVRISGDDVTELKRLGEKVQAILENVPYSQYVYRDYFNDSYMVDVKVNDELSNRLGITDAAVSQTLAGAFDGASVSTFWEGDRPVNIKLRLDQSSRSHFADIGNTYLSSGLTQARVPLRAVATLAPEWQTSRIVRRNGVRTLTIRSFVKPGHYASELLEQVKPKIKALELPAGYRIDYGGEFENQGETFPQMLVALGISLVAIFLVLLVQFRSIFEPLVVMASIPLTLFGAILGLVITHNPFGFTAFMGLISLCGIVVRNGIILVDYCNERLAEGSSLEDAACEAGARRLRPIFLTTMAAAVGVTPMILSGSSLWSPLASVIAFGLIFSMFFTLLVVPVLFVVVKGRSLKGSLKEASGNPKVALAAGVAVLLFAGGKNASAEPVTYRLTLSEAVETALKQNPGLKIARSRVGENEQRMLSARSQYFPQLSNSTKYLALSDRQLVTIPGGSLGNIGGGPFPDHDVKINQSSSTVLYSETTLAQPVTQLLKIREANEIARSERGIAQAEVNRSENDTVIAVHQLYYALLISYQEREAAQAALKAAQENLHESEEGVKSGNVLDVAVTGARAKLLQGRHALLAAETHVSDVTSELDDLLGLPSDSIIEVSEAGFPNLAETPKEESYDEARARNGELIAARVTVEKSRHAVQAARYDYIPDLTLFAKHGYQDGAPLLPRNVGIFGAELTWNIFDWGKRKGEIGARAAQQSQAEENLARIDKRIGIDLDKAYRKLERCRKMVEVACEALLLARENARLSENGLKAGTVTAAKHADTVAALKRAEMEELQASLEFRLARDEIDRLRGVLSSSR
ncbi:efflux RND transporter permease subunit [Geomesophilobacter sediminis]|uniref:Efflux RND transporter permease subunit n=1 Tax=Geomesophilobacter sediminis TaxID=2798584 RepID=A0A8J7JL06_9BACT|nr:efflux RND transporter permease subunit [Geomesophilobacter sediminis]MBJ6725085.1 efflux RND transporter permease subunit [Geomesophilobacter sediminis]